MSASLVLAAALVQASPGQALASAIDFCVTRQTSLPSIKLGSPDVPELVNNFISVPPRFADKSSLQLVRFRNDDGATAWAVAADEVACEIMLTGSPNHLVERDSAKKLLAVDPAHAGKMADAGYFWEQSMLARSKGKSGLVSMRGTGPDNTKRDEIQLDVSVMNVIAPK